ncbi:LysR family transcriptional regulator [Paracoccus laeviglucosivorans]|uniref:LysR family transcriptional regulator, glycine cleavage system transcriptional activator n=1 Tax=Paracoccus laeviglucosivorans TaxID=1197861 RepID=A0A521FED4_9RHOB|nr:LysR family transcriptional regulator [Paracoccus laeviglucosivorans]SMO94533.1 LysR family transcriptional regulator, glycine cleavage system transcriptional activator [Paracoccus laeviglucosivorans]
MTQPPLNALRAFEAVARTGSFRAAADSLFVTQPAISHQIKHLEQWLGAPLFDRGGRVPKLTPRGMALARDLTAAFDGIEAACHRARPPVSDGALVVAAIPSVAICWLIPRLPRFRAQHPDIQLRVVYAHHGHDIDFMTTDLAFTFANTCPIGEGISAEPFMSGRSVPVASPALVELAPAQLTSRWLLKVGLLHDNDPSGWQTWLSRTGQTVPARLPGTVFEDFNLLRAAALAGQGVALCSLAMIQSDLTEGRLVKLADEAVLEDFDYYLTESSMIPAHGARKRARQLFLSWIRSEQSLP